jgi:hypothetical protein
MSPERRQLVIETAIRTVRKQLQERGLRDRLADLPEGEPHKVKRPVGPPSGWPKIRPVRRAA